MRELSKIQQVLKSPKTQFNKFGNYAYRSSEDILEAVKPLLSSCTLTISDELIEIGLRVYVKATATITNGNETVSVCGFAREPESQKGMAEMQITGAASSYARKYALNGLFLIDDNKDADSMDNSKEEVKLPELKPDTAEWTNVVKGLKGGFTMKQVETKYKVSPENKKKLNEAIQD